MKPSLILTTAGLAAALLGAPLAHAVDAAAAEALAKKEGCLKCHAVDKKKDAISLKDIARKHAGKADGEAKILAQITTAQKVKLEDGTEEEHKIIDTKDPAQLKNLADWILAH